MCHGLDWSGWSGGGDLRPKTEIESISELIGNFDLDADADDDDVEAALNSLETSDAHTDNSYDHTFDSYFDFGAYDGDSAILMDTEIYQSQDPYCNDDIFTVEDILGQ